MPKHWSAEDDDFSFEQYDDLGKDEGTGAFETKERTISEKYRRQSTKGDGKKSSKDDPLRQFGSVIRMFVLENIHTINYRDIADLTGIDADNLKNAIEKCGIKVQEEKIPKWKDIDLGTYLSVSECARCLVQRRHSSFIVGEKNCRQCYEKNIAHWIEVGEPIRITFNVKD